MKQDLTLKQSKEIPENKSLEASSQSSTLGGQEQKKGARYAKTDLTGHSGDSLKIPKDTLLGIRPCVTPIFGCNMAILVPTGINCI